MISSDLKTANLSPRASLPFSWNSDGDSGIATGRPTGATAFQAHLKSAQSAQSSETGSSPVADAPQKAETAGPADPSSRVSFQNPSSDPQVRPSIKPIRKASLNLRAMVDAKVRFIGPSTASISTPSVSSSVPSAQAGPSSWGEPLGPAERSESELRRPPALTSGASPRNDVLQGMSERPLMDSQRLPDAEVVILRNRSGDPQEVPTAKQISSDVFSTPSDGGRTYASRMVAESPDYASSTDSNSEIKPEFNFQPADHCSHEWTGCSGPNPSQRFPASCSHDRDISVVTDVTIRHRFRSVDGHRFDLQRGSRRRPSCCGAIATPGHVTRRGRIRSSRQQQ